MGISIYQFYTTSIEIPVSNGLRNSLHIGKKKKKQRKKETTLDINRSIFNSFKQSIKHKS